MTSLILAMLTARRAQALIVALLALLATAGAVAGPAYQRTAERAVIGAEVATSIPLERSVQISSGPGRWAPREFATRIEPQVAVAGFTTVYAAEYNAAAQFGNRQAIPRFSYRDDVCAHVIIRAGRCASGAREVILGRRTAEGLGVGVGSEVRFTSAVLTPDGWVAGSDWTELTLVGVYDPVDPDEPYWAGRAVLRRRRPGGTRAGVRRRAHARTGRSTTRSRTRPTSSPVPTRSRVERIATLRTDLDQLQQRMNALRGAASTPICPCCSTASTPAATWWAGWCRSRPCR